MKKLVHQNVCFAFVLMMLSTITYAQPAKLKGLKNKVSKDKVLKKKPDVKKPTSTSANSNRAAYNKHIQAGRDAEKIKDFKTAYVEFSAALDAKPDDYSAKDRKKAAKNNIKSEYNELMQKAKYNGNCDQMVQHANEGIAIIGSWPDAEKYKNDFAACQESVKNATTGADIAKTKKKSKSKEKPKGPKKPVVLKNYPADFPAKGKLSTDANEKNALNAVKKYAAYVKWPEKYLKLYIENDEWDVSKNSYGIVENRWVHVYVYGTKPDGTCFAEDFKARQEEIGGGKYQKTMYVSGGGGMTSVHCK